ncbi:MAG: hypothetical protein QOE34_2863 [Verrucomicrobiota bacterium]
MRLSDGNGADHGDSSMRLARNLAGVPSRRWLAIAFIAAAVPLLFLIYLLHRYAVDVPAWDDWDMVPIIEKAHTGQFFLPDIFQQQQEARTVIPKLIIVLFSALGHWHLTYEMALSVIFSAATVLGIYLLLRQSALRPRVAAICLFLIALLLFAPTYYEVWLTGSDFSSFLPAFWLVAALVVVGTNLSITKKFIGCAILSLAGSFTLAHGLLLWGITFPLVLLIDASPRWKSWLLRWLGVCAVCVAAYFWDYQRPRDLPHFAPAVSPIDYFQYVFIFLGSALARAGKNAPIAPAALFGASGFILFCGALCHAFWRRRNQNFSRRALPWFVLGFYAIASASLAAFGRVGYGTTQALQSRYGPIALYLFVALIGLAAVFYAELAPAQSRRAKSIWIPAMGLLALALLIPYTFAAAAGVAAMRAGSANNWLGRSAVLFSRAFDTGSTIKKTIYPLPVIVRREAIVLDNLELVRPGLIKTNNVSSLHHWTADNQNATGWCESIVPRGNDMLVASGWAVLNRAGRPADGVVFTYEYPERNWVLFAMSDGISARPDIAAQLHNRDQFWSGWEATFPRSAFPPGARISAWAIDSEHAAIYRLENKFIEEHF